jgi:hypothetical protein
VSRSPLIDPDAEVAKLKAPKLKRLQAVAKQALPAAQPTEDKAVKFKDVAGRRMRVVLHQIKLIGNCSRRGDYHYTDAQFALLIGTLRKAVDELEAKFSPTTKAEVEVFSFDGETEGQTE